MGLIPISKSQALLDAQLVLWEHAYAYVKSMALKAALDLRIADAIHDCGGTATLPQIATKTAIHPSKVRYLGRLMRVLTVTGVFSVVVDEQPTDTGCDDAELVYGLTPTSRLIMLSSTTSATTLSPFLAMAVDWLNDDPFHSLAEWFRHELPGTTLFKMAYGQNVWDFAGSDTRFSKLFDDGMVADSDFTMDIMISECADIFRGVTSLVDVAGGRGGASQAISKAFPHVKCSVLDLPHVVAGAPAGTGVTYIAGDMLQSIPPANVVFLKWSMHNWEDAECVKILQNCRKAIPSRDAGGKVIIIDMLIGGAPDQKLTEMQVVFDLFIMCLGGVERDEQEWKKIILEAGFSDYKITHALGLRSIIEIYP